MRSSKKEASDRGIPEENIVNFIDNGNEIILLFPDYIIPLVCNNQETNFNLFKIYFSIRNLM